MGFSFSTPYLYGGMTFNGVPEFVKCADDLSAVGDCAGILICSILGTTWYDTTKELFPASNIVLTKDQLESIKNLIDGKCNVIQGEQYDAPEVVVRGYGYDGPYGQGMTSFTKDPLAMVTRDGDPEFAAFVSFVIRTLFLAEKENITMMTADTFAQTQSVEAITFAQSVQGISFAQATELAQYNGLRQSLAAVGNYGEMYTRHLASISPRLEMNEINNEETTGFLYSHPFGKVDTVGPEPINGGVIERILQRGFLRCGIPSRNYPDGLEDWQEARYDKSILFHMEFCRALSASVLQRTPDNVSFQSYSDYDDIYLALENGDIDVYSGGAVDVDSDFLLPGMAFSSPYFYEGGKAFALVTQDVDVQWADFVYWVTMATIYAEENGITQNTSNEMPLVNLFGTDMERLLRDAILAVGNYDEMYRRVFGQNATRVGLNMLNASPFGPQHYPYLY
ncbi:amino acid ABC transporter [Skeletonema marinoi]|uniref:Amino acid ABC transporter n=1 Tax=Skeletonema marinoi TaxID=267567 RepID=A0AAD8XTE4_9STRA|nr:amino acid ABC transporter [Skeletonema marinoi]